LGADLPKLSLMASRPFPVGTPESPRGSDDARLVELSPDLLAVMGLDGTVRRYNGAWERVLPWTRGGFTAETFRTHVHAGDLIAFETAQRTLLGGGTISDVLLRIDDGTNWREIEWSGSCDSDAGVIILSGRDATETRKLAREFALRAERLERTNADLQEFAYVASHDLSEPLRMVTSYLDLIERRYDDRLDDAGREFIHYAVDGAQRMRALIDDLLVYSRIGAAEVKREAVDLDAVLATVRHDLAAALDEAGAVLHVGTLGTVEGDAIQLGQLVQNLVANAIKFRGEEAPVIAVSGSRDGDVYRLQVRDNGIGIDPRHLARIFQVFTRLHARGEYPGTGIGLSICRRIAERHGGSIDVESVPGTGTTFTVVLPFDTDGDASDVEAEDRG
jgi:light-regulated signal transduction histidine kinase (bacteriophytochrome)